MEVASGSTQTDPNLDPGGLQNVDEEEVVIDAGALKERQEEEKAVAQIALGETVMDTTSVQSIQANEMNGAITPDNDVHRAKTLPVTAVEMNALKIDDDIEQSPLVEMETRDAVDKKRELFIDLKRKKWDQVKELCPTVSINPLDSLGYKMFCCGDFADTFFLFLIRMPFAFWLIGSAGVFLGTFLTWHFEIIIGYVFLMVISIIFFGSVLLTMNIHVAWFLLFKFESIVKIFSCLGLILSLPNTCDKPRIIDYTEGWLFLMYTATFVFTDATNLMPRMNVLFGCWTLVACIGAYAVITSKYSNCSEVENAWLDFGPGEFSARQLSLICLGQLIIFIGKQVIAEFKDIFIYQRDFCNSIKLPVKIEWALTKKDAERLNLTKEDARWLVVDLDLSDSEEETNPMEAH